MDGGHGGEGGRPLTPLKRAWENDTPSGSTGNDSSPESLPMEEESSSLIVRPTAEIQPCVEYPEERMGVSSTGTVDQGARHAVAHVEVGLREQARRLSGVAEHLQDHLSLVMRHSDERNRAVVEKIGADLTSSLNLLGQEVDQLRSRVETAEMEDIKTTEEEEKPESPDIDTKVAALGIELKEQLMNMQTQGLKMMMDNLTKGFSHALTESFESFQKTWAKDKKALEAKLNKAEKYKGELQRLLVEMREEWKTSNQQWTASWE